jgi:plasmid stabilization system protein ParE
MSFSNNDFRYPEITLYWDKHPYHLDLEIEQDRENIWVYYHNESTKEEISYWYKLENILEDRLVDKLLLFTEEAQ